MIFCHILRNLRNFFENMSYSGTSIRELNNEIILLRRKSAQDDCSIERLQSSNDCQAREIDRMARQMDQMHDERMAQGQQIMTSTINNYHAPVVSNGGTLAGNVKN